jgi:hypothetical protein
MIIRRVKPVLKPFTLHGAVNYNLEKKTNIVF